MGGGGKMKREERVGVQARLAARSDGFELWLRRTTTKPEEEESTVESTKAASTSGTSSTMSHSSGVSARALLRTAEAHASNASDERLLRRERAGMGASTGSSEAEMTVRLMVEFLTPEEAVVVFVVEFSEAEEEEDEVEVSTTAECEPVEVVDWAASSAPREDESMTMEWWPVAFSSARPGRMLT